MFQRDPESTVTQSPSILTLDNYVDQYPLISTVLGTFSKHFPIHVQPSKTHFCFHHPFSGPFITMVNRVSKDPKSALETPTGYSKLLKGAVGNYALLIEKVIENPGHEDAERIRHYIMSTLLTLNEELLAETSAVAFGEDGRLFRCDECDNSIDCYTLEHTALVNDLFEGVIKKFDPYSWENQRKRNQEPKGAEFPLANHCEGVGQLMAAITQVALRDPESIEILSQDHPYVSEVYSKHPDIFAYFSYLAGKLHDLGKIGIKGRFADLPDGIRELRQAGMSMVETNLFELYDPDQLRLLKPDGIYTPEDRLYMMLHTYLGGWLLTMAGASRREVYVALCHHERHNPFGKTAGYPLGLSGNQHIFESLVATAADIIHSACLDLRLYNNSEAIEWRRKPAGFIEFVEVLLADKGIIHPGLHKAIRQVCRVMISHITNKPANLFEMISTSQFSAIMRRVGSKTNGSIEAFSKWRVSPNTGIVYPTT